MHFAWRSKLNVGTRKVEARARSGKADGLLRLAGHAGPNGRAAAASLRWTPARRQWPSVLVAGSAHESLWKGGGARWRYAPALALGREMKPRPQRAAPLGSREAAAASRRLP